MSAEIILRQFGAKGPFLQELVAYMERRISRGDLTDLTSLSLADEGFVNAWEHYVERTNNSLAIQVLSRVFPQLSFPIEAGISKTAAYRDATLKGAQVSSVDLQRSLVFEAPCDIELRLHQTAAGSIPVIIAENRNDFEFLVRAMSSRNEPVSVPQSMGACLISGLNNWDRVGRFREQWELKNPACSWREYFPEFVKNKTLYQDRVIVLSDGSYSNIESSQLGLSEDCWRLMSRRIRLEHECAHYLTLRFFGTMQNHLLDETFADYAGICAVRKGVFRADWYLTFLGLDENGDYRKGGRMENYFQEKPLAPESFKVMLRLMVAIANNLETFSRTCDSSSLGILCQLFAITGFRLDELADKSAPKYLSDAYNNILSIVDH
ncbi:hypothetical protein A3709_12060 [Halioglobus sp. HI00S01]|uniref:DUF7005 family protein n=1 Tax=Halioglobus sp. HI00S01 TaxID=1822214 RepID=UPI0007C38AB9|nr:hypothetical protein [Halioglobus sp. HI00S01]KZX60318.1 hypothetical protein A3709_12060 [Halioglobus sp. HI00S01]